MNYRPLGRTGWNVSEISFGAWAVGGAWGTVDDAQSLAALNSAVDHGINFFDTADVYGDGRSERLLAQLRKDRRDEIIIATKIGRRLPEFSVKGYNRESLGAALDRCRENLQMNCLDLVQLHCPPHDLYYVPEAFDILDEFVQAGKLRFYGVSVERVEEALKAIEFPNVQSIQIIFNMLRHRPADLFFEQAKKKKVGILARVPLASGLLTGKLKPDTQFAADDHRQFNRHGEYFDVGETFAGVDYEEGLKAVEELRALVPAGATLAQLALRWILMFDAVTCAIPGGKTPQQVEDNVRAAALPPLDADQMATVRRIYDRYARPRVHQRW
jgi:aryl-alcohol dehydrogenase-like predicted oxidoreductase